MKLLILGIDGLGLENIEVFGLKRLKARMDAGRTGNPFVAHRLSRGWPELYTGTDAAQSGAYYQIPVRKPGGRIGPSQKTGITQVEQTLGVDRMLWRRLEAMGYRTSVMTVPTVTAAREVSGFFIGATGAGKFGTSLGADDLFPADLLDGATPDGLDLGLRIGFTGYLPPDLAMLEQKVDKHIKDYAAVLRTALERRPTDVLFMASRVLCEMAYKFMPLVKSEPTDPEARALKEVVLSLCDRCDAMLDELITEIAPENLFVVSDHGIRPIRASISLNESLVQLGYLKRDMPRTLLRKARKLRSRVRSRKPQSRSVPTAYRFESSKAFSIGYIDAIYLTDDRFGGAALTPEARKAQIDSLVEALNAYWTRKAPEAGLRFEASGAAPYSGDAQTADGGAVPNPDILCHSPEGVFNMKQSMGLMDQPSFDFSSELFRRGFSGEFAGTKTDDTYAGYVGPHGDAVRLDKLTDLYDSILAVAQQR